MIFRRSRATEKHSLFLKGKLTKADLGSGGVREWGEGIGSFGCCVHPF